MAKGAGRLSNSGVLAGREKRSGLRQPLGSCPWCQSLGLCRRSSCNLPSELVHLVPALERRRNEYQGSGESAFGRTCVATGIGHRGLGDVLKSGDSLLVAATAAELAENCIQLIN